MMAKFDHIFEQLLQMGIKIKGKINTILSKTKQKKKEKTLAHTSFSLVLQLYIFLFLTPKSFNGGQDING